MYVPHVIPTFRLDAGVVLAQAEPWNHTPVNPQSPAIDVMTDLTEVKAATTHPSTPLAQAEQQMIYMGVRMLLVVTEMPALVGLITTNDLRGVRPMQVVHARGIHYDELVVADVMTGLNHIDAIAFERLPGATVGDVVATLKRFGRNHLLVVQDAAEGAPRRVRGVFSRAQIERQLGTTIELSPVATSFSEIEQALV